MTSFLHFYFHLMQLWSILDLFLNSNPQLIFLSCSLRSGLPISWFLHPVLWPTSMFLLTLRLCWVERFEATLLRFSARWLMFLCQRPISIQSAYRKWSSLAWRHTLHVLFLILKPITLDITQFDFLLSNMEKLQFTDNTLTISRNLWHLYFCRKWYRISSITITLSSTGNVNMF